MNYKDISEETINNHIDNIIDITDKIPLHKITILTGGNACGKSVIRKLLPLRISKKLTEKNIEHTPQHCVSSVSMQARTESRPDWGALSSAMHDMPSEATSVSSFNMVKYLMRHDNPRFFVIDELEIGMSKDMTAGTCLMLNEKLSDDFLKHHYGVLVITHSETVCKYLKHDNFLNLEGLTEEEWINRDIEPVNPEDVLNWSAALFKGIQKRSK